MKKIGLLIAALFLIGMASCTATYNCNCGISLGIISIDTTYSVYTDVSKSDAEASCDLDEATINNASSGTGIGAFTCSVEKQ
jgi:hypothetical protein